MASNLSLTVSSQRLFLQPFIIVDIPLIVHRILFSWMRRENDITGIQGMKMMMVHEKFIIQVHPL